MIKYWKCTICGYIHAGDGPPESCPICGADRTLFIPWAEGPAAPLSPETVAQSWPGMIVAQAADAILAADSSGVIRLWNLGAERIFGTPASEAIGQTLDLIIPEAQRQRHWEGWAKAMRTGSSRYGSDLLSVPALRGDGRRFAAEFSIVMLKDDAGRVAGVAAILRNVTEQRERAQRLQQELAACRQQQTDQQP